MPLSETLGQDRSGHATCKLKSALHLLGEKDARVPIRAYPLTPSRVARALQLGNSISTLVLSGGASKTLVSGQGLAYVSGELDYWVDHILSRALHLLIKKQPFFAISKTDPARSITEVTGCDILPPPKLLLSTQCVVLVFANYQSRRAVVRVGACDEARSEVLRQKHGLEIASTDPTLKAFVPHVLSHSVGANGIQLLVETRLSGKPMPFSWRRVDAAKDMWLRARRPLVAGVGRPNLYEELTLVCDSVSPYRDSLCVFRDLLLEWHSKSRLPADLAHGDLWIGNVLFSGDQVAGIVDWEWGHSDGLQVVDTLYLLLASHSVFRNSGMAQPFRELWADEVADRSLRDRLRDLRLHFGLDSTDFKFVALLLWFDILRQKVIRGRMPSKSWTEDMIPKTSPAISKWLPRYLGEKLAPTA
jgi:Phosphotransferase enzyme family